jgi:hypothetical protein
LEGVSKVGLGHRANISPDLAEFGVARLGIEGQMKVMLGEFDTAEMDAG